MNTKTLFFLFIFLMYGNITQAEVWQANNTWDNYWEEEYKSWVSTNLTTNMFTDGNTLLAGIATDCADALYDVRILFSYEHSLPFVINAPDVLKEKMKVFGNDTSMFDNFPAGRERVRAFINYINNEVGTSDLFKNTFPVKIDQINSGIVYVVEWSFLGKTNRHSYMIKGFNDDHELLYYASDAPKKIRKLQIDTKYPRFSYDSSPFGFRKWKHPEHLLIPENKIPMDEGYSNEQYDLLKKFGKKGILKEINRRLQN